MIVRKALTYLCAAVALAAAVVIGLTAAAFALYAIARDHLDPPAASAIVAAAAALTALLAALILGGKLGGRSAKPQDDESTLGRILDMARDRPLVAAAVVVLGGVLAVRNPRVLALVVTSLFAAKPAKSSRPGKR